jgi:DNA repair exonuclease SbcCD nuclease subunit
MLGGARQLIIASDFHLGLSRKAHFTAESSVRRQEAAADMLRQLLSLYPPDYPFLCCGDVFDRFTNPEQVVLDAFQIFTGPRPVHLLAGNHDVDQRVGVCSSLSLLKEVAEPNLNIMMTARRWDNLILIPHCLSQELFEAELDWAERKADPGDMLVLHCNYDLDFATDHISLNLTRGRAERLLGKFSRIFIGHEHVPREDFGGRLVVVGSHYPTAFDNLGDKRHLLLDLDTHELTSVTHWYASEHVYVGPAEQAPPGLDFYDLTGDTDPKLPVQLFRQGALAVRTRKSQTAAPDITVGVPALDRLPDLITRELANQPELQSLWLELRKKHA